MIKTYTIKITGRVQGVGFRSFLYNLAVGRKADGGVRNESDGSVSLVVSIPESDIDDFIKTVRRGNGFSHVSCIKITEQNYIEKEDSIKGFSIWY